MALSSKEESVFDSSLSKSLDAVSFVCPSCRTSLSRSGASGSYHCEACKKEYSSCAGVPDFRVFPDPFFSVEEDRKRSEAMLEAIDRSSFTELLEYYWSLSDITPPLLRRKFLRSAAMGEDRARRVLSSFHDGTFKRIVRARRVLDVGSGNGNFLVLAAEHYSQVIGIDIGMRHLHVSRRRFMDRGVPIPALACCCAEYLPFPDGYFDLIVISSTLEFARDKDRMLSECARTLAPGGALYIQTVNRYSISRDPYAYLWGVGFLPRRSQAAYVRWRRKAAYGHIKTTSLRELKRLTARHFTQRQIALPDIDISVLPNFSFTTRLQIRVFKTLRTWPVFKRVFASLGPGWEILLNNG